MCEILSIQLRALAKVKELWGAGRSDGWFVEELGGGEPGMVNIMAYYGTSVYTTGQMMSFIDQIVSDCKDAGIQTMPKAEIDSLLSHWSQE